MGLRGTSQTFIIYTCQPFIFMDSRDVFIKKLNKIYRLDEKAQRILSNHYLRRDDCS